MLERGYVVVSFFEFQPIASRAVGFYLLIRHKYMSLKDARLSTLRDKLEEAEIVQQIEEELAEETQKKDSKVVVKKLKDK